MVKLTHWWGLQVFPASSDSKESAQNAGDRVQSLGRKDPLEMGMATHSSILVWRMPWTEEAGGPIVHWVPKSQIPRYD